MNDTPKKSAAVPAPALLDSAAFAAAKYPRHWLVESVLPAGRPAVIGGPTKALKTGMAGCS